MSTPRNWSPRWSDLPPVEPHREPTPPPVVFTDEEREQRRLDYIRNHERYAHQVIPVVRGEREP